MKYLFVLKVFTWVSVWFSIVLWDNMGKLFWTKQTKGPWLLVAQIDKEIIIKQLFWDAIVPWIVTF